MSPLSAFLQDMEGKTRLTADDVLAIRPLLFNDMLVSPDEADALFRLNDAASETAPEWRMLFVEAMTDYLVHQQDPPGYIDAAKADWLMDRIARDGRIKSGTELELLIHLLEQAEQASEALSRFALRQAAAFALTPERRAGGGEAITADEVSRISRVIYAFAGSGQPSAISREEAEILFDLNDAARGKANDPAWTRLFVQAVGSSLMAAVGYAPPSREEALRREAWLRAPAQGAASILANMALILLRDPLAGFAAARSEDAATEHNRDVAEAQRLAAPVNAAEAQWLMSRIGRDGALDENEAALLRFVQAEASSIDPALRAMLEAADAPTSTPSVTPVFGRRA